ncbi:hypothetical protein [Psychrobacter frigidicola]|uniref:hypothetical protein n=1 Tax=Psychrobacter frigidicola TaxID=45611 RepID=UPI0019192163|nr:hypothetical protein [Psychrobacter frigidicola]
MQILIRDDLSNSKTLAAAIKAHTDKKPDFDELNIEGLAYYNKNQDLMLGLCAPMAGNLAIIVAIENPTEVFDENAAPIPVDLPEI